jgi:exopolysaccharide biosynthesis polyprenyl glycosylphosphotransferase
MSDVLLRSKRVARGSSGADSQGSGVGSRWRPQYISDAVQAISLLGDALAIVAGLAFAGLGVFGKSKGTVVGEIQAHPFLTAFWGSAALLLVVMFTRRHLYDRHLHLVHRQSGLEARMKAVILWSAGLLASSVIIKTDFAPPVSQVIQGVPWVALMLAVWGWSLNSVIGSQSISEHLARRVVVVGWSEGAKTVVELLGNDPTHPYQVVGYVRVPGSENDEAPPASLKFLGDLSPLAASCELASLIARENIDHVLLSDKNLVPSRIAALSKLCENELAELTVIPSYWNLFKSGLRVSTLDGVPLIGVSRLPLDSAINRMLKRAVDVVGALLGLLLSAPVIALFGFLVYRESPGPIFYKQRRLGLKGRIFWMVKVRSMRLDAEQDGKVGWSTRDDPRRLKIGALMRRLNIDEMPQFWNVLKGEMSLVGPRPERPELTVQFNETIDDYNVRHGVKPGITGLAQVKGFRGDTDLGERIRLDIKYIEHWSLWNDLKLMLLTFWKNKNAC